jgi:hypothetical protein
MPVNNGYNPLWIRLRGRKDDVAPQRLIMKTHTSSFIEKKGTAQGFWAQRPGRLFGLAASFRTIAGVGSSAFAPRSLKKDDFGKMTFSDSGRLAGLIVIASWLVYISSTTICYGDTLISTVLLAPTVIRVAVEAAWGRPG